MSRMKKKYLEEILPSLRKKYPSKNVMQLPKLEKIVIAMGIGEVTKDKTAIADHTSELSMLSGQKPVVTKAKTSISNFKLREGQPLGLKVTLRKQKMYDFLDRFCNLITPRIRDFRGFKTKGDKKGSYTLGLEDQQVFPEINLDKVKRNQGMHITFVTSANNDDEMLEFLKMFSFPFKTK